MTEKPANGQSQENKGNMMGIDIALGAGVGAALGVAFNNIAIGVALGAGIGTAIGAALNARPGKK
ncbi:MAG TPA: hypothetical protein VGE45_08385 [Chloroflexia bacterium]|jgi:uncharacterized membrane protein